MSDSVIDHRQLTISPRALRRLFKQPCSFYDLLCELIDNSLQSFLSHREELAKAGKDSCTINVYCSPDKIEVTDDAYGMDKEGVDRVLNFEEVNNWKPGDLSRYGVGLKRAIWNFGDHAVTEIRTKLLYDSSEKVIVFDLDKINSGADGIDVRMSPAADISTHGTWITVTRIGKRFKEKDVNEAVSSFSRIYSQYIENGTLNLIVQGSPIECFDPDLADDENGSQLKVLISPEQSRFQDEDGNFYSYSGWIGVLSHMDASGEKSGIDIGVTGGRIILKGYRTTSLLGASNMWAFKTITGQLFIAEGDWGETANKTDFDKGGDFKLRFEASLKRIPAFDEILRIAKGRKIRQEAKKRASGKTSPNPGSEDGIGKGGSASAMGGVTPVVENTPAQPIPLPEEDGSAIPAITSTALPSEEIFHCRSEGRIYEVRVFYGNASGSSVDFLSIDSSSDKNMVTVIVHAGVPALSAFTGTEEGRKIIKTFAVLIASASVKSGKLFDAKPTDLVNALNEIAEESLAWAE